jgi:hypothetical protein
MEKYLLVNCSASVERRRRLAAQIYAEASPLGE